MNAIVRLMIITVCIGWLMHPLAAQNSGVTTRKQTSQQELPSVNTKLNQLIQGQGGRYVFLVSQGELIRLDTQTGKVAFYNLVAGAAWYTLDIPDKTVRPGNAFYEQYVQVLDKIDFNTN